MSSSIANDASTLLKRKGRRFDRLLNLALFLTMGACVMVYTLPIFSHELYAAPNTYDFGTVKAGTEVQHNFTLRNLHPWTVTVTGIRGGCGCTKAFVGKDVPFQLKPLQSVEIATSFDTTLKEEHTLQMVAIFTNDNPKGTTVILQGRVEPDSQNSKEIL